MTVHHLLLDSFVPSLSLNYCTFFHFTWTFKCSIQGSYRYWTPELKELISELSKAEAEKESKLKGILQNLIQLFVEHHSEWRQLVSVVAGNTSCDIIFFSCTIVYSFSLPKVTNILIVLWYSLLIALYHLLCSGSLWFFFANAQESCLSFHQRSYDIIKKILRMFGTVFFFTEYLAARLLDHLSLEGFIENRLLLLHRPTDYLPSVSCFSFFGKACVCVIYYMESLIDE